MASNPIDWQARALRAEQDLGLRELEIQALASRVAFLENCMEAGPWEMANRLRKELMIYEAAEKINHAKDK